MKEELGFRYAERKDTPLILAFIKALAEYIEFFQKFPFIAHGGPEIKRSGRDLQHSRVAERLHHVTDS